MTREPYPCRQDTDGHDTLAGYDPRRGQNQDDYFWWVQSVADPCDDLETAALFFKVAANAEASWAVRKFWDADHA